MPIEPPTGSRFVESEPIIENGQETWGLWKTPTFMQNLKDEDYIRYSVTNQMAGRPDKISDDIYGTTIYDWTLLAVNHVSDPLDWPKTGEVILAIRRELLTANI